MKEIELTQGKVAMVDDEDFEELNKYKWHIDKQRNTSNVVRYKRGVKRTRVYMHRAIANATEGMIVDHINGDGLDNRKSNLRVVIHRQNIQNMNVKKTSTYTGVSWLENRGKWESRISINGKSKYLGLFDVEADAYAAYLKALKHIRQICINNIPLRVSLLIE